VKFVEGNILFKYIVGIKFALFGLVLSTDQLLDE